MAPEGRVGLARGHRLNNLVELAEPRHHQVAVGEQHPVAIDDAAVDQRERVRRLALAERDELEAAERDHLIELLVGELERGRGSREISKSPAPLGLPSPLPPVEPLPPPLPPLGPLPSLWS